MVSLDEFLSYYKDKFQKNPVDVTCIKNTVGKLIPIEVTADAITKTGIYKVVRELAKTPGPGTEAITPLYNKWRSILLANQNNSSKLTETETLCRSETSLSKNSFDGKVKSIISVSESPKSVPNHPPKPTEGETLSRSQNTSKNLCNDREKLYAHIVSFPNKPVVTNGAKYTIKSSVAQEDIYSQNKGFKSSENQRNKDVVIRNGASYPVKLSDTDKNVPTWNRDINPFENCTSEAVIINNDAHFSGKLSNFEEQGSSWNRGRKFSENLTNRGMAISNEADNSFQHTYNVYSAQTSENSVSVVPKINCDKSAYFDNDQTRISKPESTSFGMMNGFHHGFQNRSQGLNIAQNFKVTNKTQLFMNNSDTPVNNSLYSTQNKYVHNNYDPNKNSSLNNHNAHTSVNALSSSSKNPADTNVVAASPNKMGKLPNPYEIEMKEGMFRVVKSTEEIPRDIARVKQMYNHEDLRNSWDYVPRKSKSKPEEKMKTPIKDQSTSKTVKSSKLSSGKKSSDKKNRSTKSKNNTPDKLKGNSRTKIENTPSKPEKRKLNLSDSAIQKSPSEKRIKEDNLFLQTESSNSATSPPKISTKEDSSTKIDSSCKEEQVMPAEKCSKPHKSSVSDTSSTKSNNSSPSKESQAAKFDNSPIIVSIKHMDYAPIHDKNTSSHKNCDKVLNKGLSDEAAEKFISSKKERTAVYSGKKSVQEIPTLRLLCIQMLKKNILESVKYTFPVPYKQLKPVLTHFTASKLRKIEENNTYLLKDSDELWKSFCKKKYPDVKPVPHETWRELFWRIREDQEKKLKSVSADTFVSMSKAAAEKKVAIIESPKTIHKRMKSSDLKTEVTPTKASSKETLNHKNSLKESISSHSKTSRESSSSNHKKPKKAPVAPLMSKVKKTLGIHKK